ncbi:mucin-2 [Phlebotomus argentipes]|uniref:mucin-2 n=1 Tax=Phlebotomus argentipes TaxID=94469 RepID=UPI0028931BB0|nr:mucin-2 [Phlebotomus argentipes]
MSKKNPLLSSAALTFDDFTHNARLMPAAAPVPVATVVPDVQGSRGHSEEPKEEIRPALFGSPPPPVATEAFSDISLEPTAEQQGSFLGASEPQLYNPLQGIDPYGSNAKPPSVQGGESLFNPLAQAAQLKESLQHIPSVASTVFSTFSSILKGGEGAPGQQESTGDPPPNTYKSPLDAIYEQQVLNPAEQSQASPLLFSPEDPSIPAFSHGQAPPPAGGSTNTFRLGGNKKKIYAPVPGLSSGGFSQAEVPAFSQKPQNLPPLPEPRPSPKPSPTPPPVAFFPTPQAAPYQNSGGFEQVNSSIPVPQEQPQQSQSKFSLSSFFSAPLLDRFQGKTSAQNEPVVAEISSVDSVQPAQNFQAPPPVQPPQLINPQLFNTNPIAGESQNAPFAVGFPPVVNQQSIDPPPVSQSAFFGAPPVASTHPPPVIPANPSPVISAYPPPAEVPTAPPTNTANPFGGYRLAKKTPSYKNALIPETKTNFFVPETSPTAQSVPVNFFTPAAPVPVVTPSAPAPQTEANYFTPAAPIPVVTPSAPAPQAEANYFTPAAPVSAPVPVVTPSASAPQAEPNYFTPAAPVPVVTPSAPAPQAEPNYFTPAAPVSAPVSVVTPSAPAPQAELKTETKVSSPTIFKSTSEPVASVRPDQAFFLPKSPTETEKIPYAPEASSIDQLCTELAETKLPQVSQTASFFGNQTATNWFDTNQNTQLAGDHTTVDEDVNKNQTDIHASFFDCPPELKPDQAQPSFFSFPKPSVDDVSINNNSLIVEKSSVDDSKVSLASFPSNEREQQPVFLCGTVVPNGREPTRETFPESQSIVEEQPFNANLLDTTTSMATSKSTPTGQEPGKSVTDAAAPSGSYRPVYKHWFYKQKVEGKDVWTPFSMTDSLALEDALTCPTADNAVIATDGGRHDVSIAERTRTAIYWSAEVNEVRRCSWFYKAVDSRFVPYEEETADYLEEEYKNAFATGSWHKQLTLPNGEMVNFHGPNVMVHFLQAQTPDAWGNTPQVTNRPRVVKRGVDEFNIEDGEPEQIDHVLFVVHGIGKACDFKFRTVEEVVDEFRNIALQMVQSHYRSSYDAGEIGRIEVLPISWHSELHSEESGIDAKLKSITLESIPKLRNFTNDTLLDVLFYTSPIFCQSIMDTVCGSVNRLYKLFCERNPSYHGGVSLAGHSLGSLILFDLLCHQKAPSNEHEMENSENPDQANVTTPTEPFLRPEKQTAQQINYTMGPAGTGQPFINYPQLDIRPKNFFAFGSPIGMFVTVRGIDTLGLDFKLPTCDGFYNIFHPYDIVAYRIEGLVNADLSSLRPVLIPHHKGRKRMHLELRETMVRVGGEIKQRIFDTFRSTVDTVTHITSLGRTDPQAIKCEVDKVLEEQLHLDETQREISGAGSSSGGSDCDTGETDLPLGRLNQARRIDYVLQEAPLEFFNEYIFALTSHVCYWQSEDTILFVVKEIYSSLGVQTDNKVPQQSLTIERPTASLPAR